MTGTVKDCEKVLLVGAKMWILMSGSYQWAAWQMRGLIWIGLPCPCKTSSGEIIRKLGLCDEPPPEFIKMIAPEKILIYINTMN